MDLKHFRTYSSIYLSVGQYTEHKLNEFPLYMIISQDVKSLLQICSLFSVQYVQHQ